MKIVEYTKENESEIINQAKEVLENDGIIVYPTETVYGIGVKATSDKAVRKLLEYKGRREGKAISIAVSSKNEAEKYININEEASNLFDIFTPGPVTIIGESKGNVSKLIEGQAYGWITSKTNFSILGYNYTGYTSIILYSLILSGVFLLLFIYIQYIKSKKNLEPAIDLSFFRFRTYRYGLIAISIISLGEFSALFTLPIYLQIVRGLNALQSGLLTLPLAFGALVAAPTAAFGVNKIGTKIIVSSGIFLEGLGIFLVSNISPNMKLYTLLPALLILGLGIGLAISQNTQVILSEIPHNKSGSASGVLNTIRQVGSSMGVALIGAILSAGLSTNVQNNLNKVSNVPSSVKTQIVSEINSNNFSTSSVSMPPVPLQIRENKYLYQKYVKEEETIGNNIKNAVDDGITTSISNSIRFASIKKFSPISWIAMLYVFLNSFLYSVNFIIFMYLAKSRLEIITFISSIFPDPTRRI